MEHKPHTKFNPHALYYDASNAPHYGKYLNDLWDHQANNCELRRNPATGQVEVYAIQDIPINAALGMAYDAPFWYQPENGLTNRQQAIQVKTYYQRSKLPPWKAQPQHLPPQPPLRTHPLQDSPPPTTQPQQLPHTVNTPNIPPADCPNNDILAPCTQTRPFAISASTQIISAQVANERQEVDRHYGLECTLNQPYRRTQQHELQHPTMY